MEGSQGVLKEIAVPASVFVSLRNTLTEECGPLPTLHALHAAGYAAGTDAVSAFKAGLSDGAEALAVDDFWARATGFLDRRGWGRLSHSATNPAVGILTSSDWMEATPDRPSQDGSCSFSTGFLSGFLSGLAGGPVAVLEVSCRSRGDDVCEFVFGSESAVHELYGQLVEGKDLDGALADL